MPDRLRHERPLASVIVPARNAAGTLQATLDGLAEQTFSGPFEVIVVDDASHDETLQIARSSSVVQAAIHGPGAGPARARNIGVLAARADRLVFLDADCRPTPEWLGAGLEALLSADLVQGAVLATPGVELGPFDRTLSVTRAWGLFESANLFVCRRLFEALGGFESWLQPRRGIELAEDTWFGWRARRAGARTDFCERALVHHAVFRRGAASYVIEHARRRFFPHMAARIPELRTEFLWRRYFLSPRSAAFDLALAAATVAAVKRQPIALAGTVPYAQMLVRSSRVSNRRLRAQVVLAGLLADSVGAAALLAGSLAAGAPVL